MNHIFKQLDISVEYFLSQPHPVNGMYGCFDSHIRVWQKALNYNDDELIVIFEDDTVAHPNVTPKLFQKMLRDSAKLLDEYDIIHLGRTIQNVDGQVLKRKTYSFWRGNVTMLHLYVMKVSNIRQNIDKIKRGWGEHIDQVILKEMDQIFLNPDIFIQRDIFDTNNDWGNNDKLIRYMVGIYKSFESFRLMFDPGTNLLARKMYPF